MKEPEVVQESDGAESQAVIRVGQVEFTRLVQTRIWPRWGKAQHRKDGVCLPAALEKDSTQGQWQPSLQPLHWGHTTQFLSICLWRLGGSVPLPEPRVSDWERVCVFVCRPSKKILGFLVAFHLTCRDGITSDFHNQMFCGVFFLALGLWAGEPSKELGPFAPQGGTSAAEISLPVLS